MLTIEMLTQSAALVGLTDAQREAIAEMSKNDENTVIGKRIGELHGQYDADILALTGVAKRDGEKSYDYAKRVIGDYKTKSESASATKKELEAANAKVTELQTKLEQNSGDETLRQQLKDSKAQVTQLQASLKAKETELDTKKAEFDKTIKATHIDYAFSEAVAGIKFKDGITESIQKTLLSAAKAEILAKGTPDFVEGADGSKKLVLRGADGNILNNPKNNLNPYTIAELVSESSLKDAIAEGRKQTGGDTKPNGNNRNNGVTLDLSSVKSQVEADKAIEAHLLANGLTRDSREFSEQSLQLRADNNVADLPLQ